MFGFDIQSTISFDSSPTNYGFKQATTWISTLIFLEFTCHWIQLFPFISHQYLLDAINHRRIIEPLDCFLFKDSNRKTVFLIPFPKHKLLPWKLESYHTLHLTSPVQLTHSDNLKDSKWRKDCFIWLILYRLIRPILFDTRDQKHRLSIKPLNSDWRRPSLNFLNSLL